MASVEGAPNRNDLMETTMTTKRSLTAAETREVKAATQRVNRTRAAAEKATAARHRLWRRLVDDGVGQSEVARVAGVIKQAVSAVAAGKGDS